VRVKDSTMSSRWSSVSLTTACLLCASLLMSGLTSTAAFSPVMTPTSTRQATAHSVAVSREYVQHAPSLRSMASATRLFADRQANNAGIELVSTLERLDRQWKLQQRSKPTSRWSKLVLQPEAFSDDAADPMVELPPESSIPTEEFVYLLEPPNQSRPSCMIVFVGGAGLGQFPHIAYNECLLRLSNKMNAAIVAVPYSVGLDHFGLSKTVGELARRARIHCQEDSQRMYPANLPTYYLSHSLGGKLGLIYMAATGQTYDGIGMMSFNNFGFGQTVKMVQQFADQIQKTSGMGSGFGLPLGGRTGEILNQVFSFAETIVGSIGIDFSPNPLETERIIQMKYDAERQNKTRLFVFDDDTLDSTPSFVQACQDGSGPTVAYLPGSHLTPVYFKLGLDDLPAEARQIASDAMGGLNSASFGNEGELDALVEELSGWLLGKNPSRSNKADQPLLAGMSNEQ
jgi:Protein of unknown function (DUF1350)